MTDELDSGAEEDSCDDMPVLIRFNEEEPMTKDFIFKVGMEFSSLKQFKKVILEYNIFNGMRVRFSKSDSMMCTVIMLRFAIEITGCMDFKVKNNVRQVVEGDSSLDGFHLKTKYGGMLLIVVGRGPNDQYFTISFEVVQNETKDSYYSLEMYSQLDPGTLASLLNAEDFGDNVIIDIQPLSIDTMVRRRGADGRIPVRTLDRGASSSAAAAEPTGYPGGPYDTSLLVKYEHHVARHIWFGEERGPKKELKVAGHGLKLNSRVPLALPPQMESWVSRSGLASLQRTSLNKIDTNLVSAFVERWHLETSSFHMLFGEMSITLDDVACLLHLPIRGIFWSPQDVTEELAVELAVDYLGVSQSQAQSHVRSCRGSYYKLEWLYDIFVHHRAASSWAYATRAYLLMLVGSTIFADKTFTLVEARYLLLFRDLDGCSGYSWGAAALVTLYRYLGDASMYSCKQLGGYPTLLQTGSPEVDDLRPILDELTPTDVIWRPFEDHRAWRVFDEICLYRGCLKWGETVVPYLPDRCLRQFGYRQYVPSPPLDCMMATDIDVDWISYHQSVVDVIGSSSVATTPSEVVDGYLEWYYRVSHPRLVPPHRDAPREVPVPVYDAGPSDPDWARVSTLIRRYLRQVNAEEEDPQFSDLFEALHISRSH
ncbi:hypothetical protein KIW84_051270 [Lathyrus oleraceus]|uniref:Aminotransferase-like plant mobile domain-containing protein n=1 Tax=Pisum sativum TaxID=3888 RepID=A0A9D5ADD7_PEA|nr:hypothetical protein KIW84_051270 [Pisum sativum]